MASTSAYLTICIFKYTLECMEYLTATNLRTQTSRLIKTLQQKGSVALVHRSKIVGIVQPIQEEGPVFNSQLFNQYLGDFQLPPTTPAERKAIYTKQLQKKYGKNFS